MNHVTSIGLDVHARSISACALNPMTGEISRKQFGYDLSEVASWIQTFESPKAVYESGVLGFDPQRKLTALGVDCVVGAVTKMVKPAGLSRQKNDKNDAEFLARLLATHNVVEVAIPDQETEAAHDLVRIHDDLRQDLMRARNRLIKFLMRHGYIYNEKTPGGHLKQTWGNDHKAWIKRIKFDDAAANETLELYFLEVLHLEGLKKEVAQLIKSHAQEPRWKERVDALCCLKGIETITAFTLVVEAGSFSRFKSPNSYAAWLGLAPSEHSSGEKRSSGSITKTGNSLCRRLYIEAAWHYIQSNMAPKKPPCSNINPFVLERAAKATRRLVSHRRALKESGKRPAVANCATARELACFVQDIGKLIETIR